MKKQQVTGLLFLLFFLSCTLSYAGWGSLPDFTKLARDAGPAVVNISTVKVIKTSKQLRKFFGPFHQKGTPFDDFFNRFFGNIPQKRKERALGSGFIISKDGYIVTNNHVVKNADQIKVILQGGKKKYPARIIGTDPETDLALVKIDPDHDLPVLEFGDSDQLQVGQWVLAIGNPFGLDHTVTAGIISAKGRVIGAGPYDNFLQTDASINPGNSGGPLINMDGRVVGINTAIVASGQGIGFAIPSNLAKTVIAQLKEYKKVKRGWLGVTIQDVDENTAKALGLSEPKGALIASVKKGDPADRAGIEVGDVVVAVDGKPVQDAGDLTRKIGAIPPNKTIEITLWRSGQLKVVKVKLGERHINEAQAGFGEGSEGAVLGMRLKPLNDQEAQALGMEKARGLLVLSVEDGSPASEANLQRGDVILKANGHDVNAMDEFSKQVSKAKKKGVLLLYVKRRGQNLFRTILIPQK